MMTNAANRFLVRSKTLPENASGELLHLTRSQADWAWMSFFVRRLAPGQAWGAGQPDEETGIVLLGGRCTADWGEGQKKIGQRANVFDGLPYALYLPPGSRAELVAETVCELAECRVPAKKKGPVRLIKPCDVTVSLRGGGNASRQIVDVLSPAFPADRLILIEVYTPSGNWSSYPPHKHDVHNPPTEVDLDEIYYFRTEHPAGYAYQRLYTPDNGRDLTLTVRDGDTVLVRDGYHPVVAGHGYNVYYLNCLAGSARTLSFTEDPKHAWVKSNWKEMDPRLPLVKA
jgi:5-deoxy-glucuronate isomerase